MYLVTFSVIKVQDSAASWSLRALLAAVLPLASPILEQVGFWVHQVKQVLDDIESPVFVLGVHGEGSAKSDAEADPFL